MRVRRVVPDFHADDPAASATFYAGVLGMRVAMDQGWIVTFAAPGVRRFFVREPGGKVLDILSDH